jgi:hypothetical protein
VTTSGLQYPFEFLGYSADEPVGLENQLTPLGQRQHYLIGSELRTRYVDEAKLLRSTYLISQNYLQVPQWSTNIQSMQAQMMGLYPASTLNELNEWQQINAVPPIEGYDFTKWQSELGSSALPYGLNTFPINQVGRSADYELALCERNCPQFTDLWGTVLDQTEGKWFKIAGTTDSKVTQGILYYYGIEHTCSYIDWAYMSYVDLDDAESFDWIRTNICPGFYQDLNEAQAQLDVDNENLVSAGFFNKLAAQLSQTPSDVTSLVYNSWQPIDSYHMYTLVAASGVTGDSQ